MFRKVAAIVLCLACSACAIGTKMQLPPPNTEQLVLGYLRVNLKDPESMRDLSIYPIKPFPQAAWWMGTDPAQTWEQCVSLNAKNSFGGYTGIQYLTIYIGNGVAYTSSKGCR